MTYIPRPGEPQDFAELRRYVQTELQRISAALKQLDVIAPLLHAEPKNPSQGQIVVADGSDWNPVGGSSDAKLVGWSGSAWIEIKIFA